VANVVGGVWRYGRAKLVREAERPIYMLAIGKRIRDKRLEKDIAISELSAATRLHYTTIKRLEDGDHRRDFGMWTLVRIALALGCQPSELMP
jgi:DNA-binding Xre family transcriptional regulator